MPLTEQVLEVRARRAYELGRLRWSLRVAPFVLIAAGAAMACGRPPGASCALGVCILALATGLGFAGGGAGRAVLPGLVGGSAALAMPLLVGTVGFACIGQACMSFCLPACVLGGAIAGALIGVRARREERGASFVLPALLLAGLTGALGCTMAGVAGVVGMVAGALVAGTPVLLVARR
jgi:hypothetical protein